MQFFPLYADCSVMWCMYVGNRLAGVCSNGPATVWSLAVVSCVHVCMLGIGWLESIQVVMLQSGP